MSEVAGFPYIEAEFTVDGTLNPPGQAATISSFVQSAPPPVDLLVLSHGWNNDIAVPWLRDQAFSGLAGSNGPQRRAWKYLLGAVVLALAGFAYLQWAPGPRAGVAPSSPAPPVTLTR